jgi:acetate kinase
MAKYTLAVNAGSSSLKCRLFKNDRNIRQLVSINVSGLNSDDVEFKYDPSPENRLDAANVSTHEEAFAHMVKQLRADASAFGLGDLSDFVIAHRVVHGGDFEKPVEINDGTYHYLHQLNTLAPLSV